MNLLEIINIKNEFHILILKAKEKAKSKEQLKNLSVLTETLELLHILHKKIDELNTKKRKTDLELARKYLEIKTLKIDINTLNKRIKNQNKEIEKLMK